MESTIINDTLIQKKQKLQAMAAALKERFLGLDAIIDEVVSLMMPWYLFPDAQLRPTVVNLWGLTGSGKTALVQAIVEALNYRDLYTHLDMGEFESDSASWIKNILVDNLDFFDGKPALICLDEFQFARTLDKSGQELGKDKLRVVWDLLDSGKIDYIPGRGTYYLFRADNCLGRLNKAHMRGVVLSNGRIEHGLADFIALFKGFFFSYDNRGEDVKIDADYFLSEDFIDGMYMLFDDYDYTKDLIMQRIRLLTLPELIVFINQGMHTRPATKTLDLSAALIFVLGNLDEAYTMSRNMNPDISADEFHEQTAKINIADIKVALKKRFRPEQIARLGNNHIIYTSFNNRQFRMLIVQELARIAAFVAERFGWKIVFDDSVIDVVYAEGVFPAQGTRPVLTTIKNLVESRVSALAVSVLEQQLSVATIAWAYADGQFNYRLSDADGNLLLTLSDKAKLKLENLRKSVDPELQAHTAVHEAGHAVLAAITLRIVPSVVVSRTASEDDGFCLVDFPKGPMTRETIGKDIVISLGGYVAERMIFGEQFTSSGVSYDIEEATRLANRAIRKYAMGTDPIHIAIETDDTRDAFFLSNRYAEEAIRIIRDCEVEAERILTRNKLLLLKISEYLTSHSRMERELIAEYVVRYGKEDWIQREGLITKDQYYKFNTVLQSHLKEFEQEAEQADINGLVSEARVILLQ